MTSSFENLCWVLHCWRQKLHNVLSCHFPFPCHLTTAESLSWNWTFCSPFLVQNAVGVTIENWTNQKLEFPEDFISEGARDMWYKPSEVRQMYICFNIVIWHIINISPLLESSTNRVTSNVRKSNMAKQIVFILLILIKGVHKPDLEKTLISTQVRRHTRDFGLLAHGVRGSQSRGSLCYLIEDSWPMYTSHHYHLVP